MVTRTTALRFEQSATHLPQGGEEPLVRCALQVLRAERAAGPGRHRPDDAFDELNMFEPPLGEALLVFQQRLGKEIQNVRSRSRVQLVEREILMSHDSEKQGFECRPRQGMRYDVWNLASLLQRLHERFVAR